MVNGDQLSSSDVDNEISVPSSLIRIYSQPLFYKSEETNGIELEYRHVSQPTTRFYAECSQRDLIALTCGQLALIESLQVDFTSAGLQQVILKVQPRVLFDVVPAIIYTAEKMKSHGVELIVSVHERLLLANNRVDKSVCILHGSGISLCLGGYDWVRTDKRKKYLSSDMYRYICLANPPLFMNEADLFLDVCFEIARGDSCRLIVDKVQSRMQHELVKKTPYYALKGLYLGRPRLLLA